MADIGTSEWWLTELEKQLSDQQQLLRRPHEYYEGRHQVAFATDQFLGTGFRNRFRSYRANFCRLVVQAVEERLTVTGFRFGAEQDPQADADAWRIWQSNQMDDYSQRAHREALISGVSSALVWPRDNGEDPLIRVMDPTETVVRFGTGDEIERAAALRVWMGDDGRKLATLYLPDRVEKYQWVSGTGARSKDGRFASGYWGPRNVDGEPWPLPNPFGVVPVIPLLNDPDLRNVGTSEIGETMPLQDGLNESLVDLLVNSHYSAFRQKWAAGIEIPVDPETGQALEPYKITAERVWATPNETAKFGTFDQSDMTGMVRAIEQQIQIIASTTRTPPHYLLGQAGSFPSGESLRAAETGLVAKARRRQRDFGEAWEEVMRLAFLALGEQAKAEAIDAETIWRDPETTIESAHVDAIVKKQTLGVPNEQLWEDLGYSPQQIIRFKRMRAEEALLVPLPPVAPPIERLTVTSPSSTPAPADQTHLPMNPGQGAPMPAQGMGGAMPPKKAA